MPGLQRRPRQPRYKRRVQVTFGPRPEVAHRGFTSDVSAGGFCLMTFSVQPPGTNMFLSLSTGDTTVKVQGVVMWARAGLRLQGMTGAMGIRLTVADEAYYKLVLSLAEGAAKH
jgi:hypothetical protein